jgi:hypothetical protein
MVNEMGTTWKDRLPNALWAYRIAYKTPLGMSPYQLIYGKTCHLPMELEFKAHFFLTGNSKLTGSSNDGTWTLKPQEPRGKCNSLSLMNGMKKHITMPRYTRREPKGDMTRESRRTLPLEIRYYF